MALILDRAAEKNALPLQDRVQLEYLIKAWKESKEVENSSISFAGHLTASNNASLSGTTIGDAATGTATGAHQDGGAAVKYTLPIMSNSEPDHAEFQYRKNSKEPYQHSHRAMRTVVNKTKVSPGTQKPMVMMVSAPSSFGHDIRSRDLSASRTTAAPPDTSDNARSIPEMGAPQSTGEGPAPIIGLTSAELHDPAKRIPTSPNENALQIASPLSQQTPSSRLPKRQQKMSIQLSTCVSAVARLSAAIEKVAAYLQQSERGSDLRKASRTYGATKRAMEELLAIDQEEVGDAQ